MPCSKSRSTAIGGVHVAQTINSLAPLWPQVMGVFRVRVQVFSLQDPERREEVDTVVDTGAFRTLIPFAVVEALGVSPISGRPSE